MKSSTTTPEFIPIQRSEAMDLAETAYARLADVLEGIRDDQWQLPTDCAGWTVRDMAGHILGACDRPLHIASSSASKSHRCDGLGGRGFSSSTR